MIGIVIVAHCGLAGEYLAAMEHVVGAGQGTRAVCIGPDDEALTKQMEISAAMAAVDQGAGVVIVTDLYGGTPSNLARAVCGRADRRILCGANLPMLVKLAKMRHRSLDDAVQAALQAGRKYIHCVDELPHAHQKISA